MFIRNIHVSLCSINLRLENSPGKKCIWKRICQIHQIRWIKYKYKYKYMAWYLIKYKYKYKYAVFVFVFVFANTNTYLTPALLMNGRADWHGTKGMWVDRMLHPLCEFQHSPHQWPWPWIFKVKFWKCCISWMEGPIDMERKRCESIGCYTHFVTFNIPLTNDLDLGFSRSNFEKVISQELDGRLTWN